MAEIDKGWRTRDFPLLEDPANAGTLVDYIRVILSVFIWTVETSITYPLTITIRVVKFVRSITFKCHGRQGNAARLDQRDEEEMVVLLRSFGTEETVPLVSLVAEKNDFVVVTSS